MKNTSLLALAALSLACAAPKERALGVSPQDPFWNHLYDLCDRAYEGRVASDAGGPAAGPYAGKKLVMHVRDCTAREIRVPFHVGEDRSRTWVLTREGDNGLRLKHDHRRADGTPDKLSMYGGDTPGPGEPGRQTFPADAHSKSMFERDGMAAASASVWSVALEPGKTLTYGVERPGRSFFVEFDLTHEVPAPPSPWGAE